MEFTPEKRKKLSRWLIGIATACRILTKSLQRLLNLCKLTVVWYCKLIRNVFLTSFSVLHRKFIIFNYIDLYTEVRISIILSQSFVAVLMQKS